MDKVDNLKIKIEMAAEFEKMISLLLSSQTQAHVYHLQTESYAEHKALQKYYEGIDALTDGLAESYQGKFGIIKDYTNYSINSYKSTADVIKYFKALHKNVETLRKDSDVEDNTYLQNQIDTVNELIASTLYKLSYLK